MNNTDRNLNQFWGIMGFASWLSVLVLIVLCLLLTSCRWPGVDQHEHDRVTQPQTTNSPAK